MKEKEQVHKHECGDNCSCGHNHNHEHNVGVGYYLSPIGFIEVKTDFNFITSISFVKSEQERVETYAVIDAIKQIDEYFKGTRKVFNLKIALAGTPFQKEVYKALLKIPFGKTMSYKDVAAMIGDPKAARAIGNANNKNQVLLAIPCHRVTAKGEKLSGTKEWKQKQKWLIEHEKSLSE